MIPAKPLTGVPMTYGVENRSSNTFAAGNPTDEITRFTSLRRLLYVFYATSHRKGANDFKVLA